VTRQVAHQLAAGHRHADQCDASQVELVEHRREIIREGVVIVAGAGIARTSVSAPIVRHGPKALLGQRHHLIRPHVGRQTPRGEKHHGIAGPPVAIEEALAIARVNERPRTTSRRRAI